MPGTSIKADRPRIAKRDRRRPVAVALIAVGDPRERVCDILEQQEFEPVSFDGVEDLLEHRTEEVPAPIVLWIDDALSPLAAQIEPLRGQLEGMPVVLICPSIERWEVRAALAGGVAGEPAAPGDVRRASRELCQVTPCT